jgi:hypothetical protein
MANFCTQCGKKLEENQGCDCTQQVADGVENVAQPEALEQPEVETPVEVEVEEPVELEGEVPVEVVAPTQAEAVAPGQPDMNKQEPSQQPQQQTSKEAEWISEKREKVIAEAKNIFAEIKPLLKNPISYTKQIAKRDAMTIGLEFIGLKVVISIIITLMMMGRVNTIMSGGFFGGYKVFNMATQFKAIFLIIIFVGGTDILEALLLKVCAGVFNMETTFNKMITVTGTKALFESTLILAAGLVSMILPRIAMFMILGGMILGSYLQYSAFNEIVTGDIDKKPYVFAIAKVAIMAILFLTFTIVLTSALGGVMDIFSYMM